MKIYKVLFFLFLFSSILFSNKKSNLEKPKNEKFINIYLDCQFCDVDFIRTKINFVNYVIDRKEADVHILVTRQTTGSNGKEYTLTFLGKNKFASNNDTIKYFTQENDTDDKIRQQLAKYLSLGLMRYIAETDVAKSISINYASKNNNKKAVDNWDYWVVRTSLRGYFNGEKSSKMKYLNGSVRINRITEDWKFRTNLGVNYNDQSFSIGDRDILSISRQNYANLTLVKSVSDHFSVGFVSSYRQSSYSNHKLQLQFYPAIEYNIYPYSESTRKVLRFLYRTGYNYAEYYEETIYDKMSEGHLSQSLDCVLELKQPWGTVETTLSGSNYFYDFNKNKLDLSVELTLRLFKGFSLEINGFYSMIHDQLFLPKQSISDSDILLQRRQMETQYRYWGMIGISYTFGSIYNNIVNPRFGN